MPKSNGKSSDRVVVFTPESAIALRVAYNRAVKDNVESFTFEGSQFATSHAKFLLEYLSLPGGLLQ